MSRTVCFQIRRLIAQRLPVLVMLRISRGIAGYGACAGRTEWSKASAVSATGGQEATGPPAILSPRNGDSKMLKNWVRDGWPLTRPSGRSSLAMRPPSPTATPKPLSSLTQHPAYFGHCGGTETAAVASQLEDSRGTSVVDIHSTATSSVDSPLGRPCSYAEAWLQDGGQLLNEMPEATVEDLRKKLHQFRRFLQCMAEEMERGHEPRSSQQLSFLSETLVELDESKDRITSLETALDRATTAKSSRPPSYRSVFRLEAHTIAPLADESGDCGHDALHDKIGHTSVTASRPVLRVEPHTVPPAPIASERPIVASGTPAAPRTRRPRRRRKPPATTGRPVAIASAATQIGAGSGYLPKVVRAAPAAGNRATSPGGTFASHAGKGRATTRSSTHTYSGHISEHCPASSRATRVDVVAHPARAQGARPASTFDHRFASPAEFPPLPRSNPEQHTTNFFHGSCETRRAYRPEIRHRSDERMDSGIASHGREPPFVAVLRRHAGFCRNFALHGVCSILGCTRQHEAVPPTVELDVRHALRDRRLHHRRLATPAVSAAPRAVWRPVDRPPVGSMPPKVASSGQLTAGIPPVSALLLHAQEESRTCRVHSPRP